MYVPEGGTFFISHRRTDVFGSNPHIAFEDAMQFTPEVPSPRYNSMTISSKDRVVRRDVNVRSNVPPFSSGETRGRRENGIGTWLGGAERDVGAGGAYRYSIKVNFPSGGTKESALSRFQRCRLFFIRV